MSDKEKIRVERRRKGEGPEGKPRAKAPSREKPREAESGGGRPPTRPSSGLPTSTGRGMKLPLWLVVVLVIVFIGFNLLSGGSPDETVSFQESQPTQETFVNLPTQTSKPVDFIRPPASGEGQTWLVMLYQDADDKILEKDIFSDLNEAEKVGSTDRVTIVAQLDRYHAAYSVDGDWTSGRRYYETKDDDLNRIGSQMVQDLGEINMAYGQVLVDFVVWAM